MSDQPELSDVVIDGKFEYLAAPITEPDQIQDTEVKRVVTSLMQKEEKPLERIERYRLAPLPEEEDHRPWYTRAVHWALMRIPNQRTSLQKKIETEKVIANAKAQAEWLAQSVTDIQQWTTRARTAY